MATGNKIPDQTKAFIDGEVKRHPPDCAIHLRIAMYSLWHHLFSCPECGGNGTKGVNIPATEERLEEDIEVICEECNGDGKLMVDVERVLN